MILNRFYSFSYVLIFRVHTTHVVALIPRVCIVFNIPARHLHIFFPYALCFFLYTLDVLYLLHHPESFHRLVLRYYYE